LLRERGSFRGLLGGLLLIPFGGFLFLLLILLLREMTEELARVEQDLW